MPASAWLVLEGGCDPARVYARRASRAATMSCFLAWHQPGTIAAGMGTAPKPCPDDRAESIALQQHCSPLTRFCGRDDSSARWLERSHAALSNAIAPGVHPLPARQAGVAVSRRRVVIP